MVPYGSPSTDIPPGGQCGLGSSLARNPLSRLVVGRIQLLGDAPSAALLRSAGGGTWSRLRTGSCPAASSVRRTLRLMTLRFYQQRTLLESVILRRWARQ